MLYLRRAALKAQDLYLSKLVTSAFGVPALRLVLNKNYNRASDVVLKLASVLELGMLLGASLPLLLPFLFAAIMSERLLAAVAWQKLALKDVAESGQVYFQLVLKITWAASALFYTCFACQDAYASAAQSLAMSVTIANWLRCQRACL